MCRRMFLTILQTSLRLALTSIGSPMGLTFTKKRRTVKTERSNKLLWSGSITIYSPPYREGLGGGGPLSSSGRIGGG